MHNPRRPITPLAAGLLAGAVGTVGLDTVHYLKGLCCVARWRCSGTRGRGGPVSDCDGELAEDRLEPAAGLSIKSEFVVAVAQILNERMPATDHLGAAEPVACQNCRVPSTWRFNAAQAIRWYSLITPPRTRCRRIGVLSGMTHAGSWLGGR
jgi:hypothetical protein